jgi:DNA-binding NtrC family response regulator
MRILLVEDNVRLRAIVSQAFTGNGFAGDTAECAADAQAAIQAIAYLAVILDLGFAGPGRNDRSFIYSGQRPHRAHARAGVARASRR